MIWKQDKDKTTDDDKGHGKSNPAETRHPPFMGMMQSLDWIDRGPGAATVLWANNEKGNADKSSQKPDNSANHHWPDKHSC
jgi:hypothetical protein